MLFDVIYIIDLDTTMDKVREKLAERDKPADPGELRAMVHEYSDDDGMYVQALEVIHSLLEEKRLTSSTRKKACEEVEAVRRVRDKLADVVMGGASVVQELIIGDTHEIVKAAEYVRSCGMFRCDFGCDVRT